MYHKEEIIIQSKVLLPFCIEAFSCFSSPANKGRILESITTWRFLAYITTPLEADERKWCLFPDSERTSYAHFQKAQNAQLFHLELPFNISYFKEIVGFLSEKKMTQLYVEVNTAEDECIVIESMLMPQWENLPEVQTAINQHLNCWFKIFDDKSLAQQLFKPTVLSDFWRVLVFVAVIVVFFLKKAQNSSTWLERVSYLIRNPEVYCMSPLF